MAVHLQTEFPENFDQERLRNLGELVRQRLENDPATAAGSFEDVEIFVAGTFMTAGECSRMIAMIDAVAAPSTLYDADYATSGYRTSFSANFDPGDPFVVEISERIDALLGIEGRLGETIQGQRYLPGQEFRQHHDWFHYGMDYWEREMRQGGQRSFTAMVYLNGVESGGGTSFPYLDLTFQPSPGALIIWNNARRDGSPNPRTLHAGCPVVSGSKYIITKWYRTRPWLEDFV
jgi:prolyl 4-hydroxylase